MSKRMDDLEYLESDQEKDTRKRHKWDNEHEVPLLKSLYVQFGKNVPAITKKLNQNGYQVTQSIVRSKLQVLKSWVESVGII